MNKSKKAQTTTQTPLAPNFSIPDYSRPLLTAAEMVLLRAGRMEPDGGRVVSSEGLAKVRRHIESMELGVEIMRRDGSELMSQPEIREVFADFVEGFISHAGPAIGIWTYVATKTFDIHFCARGGSRMPQEEIREVFATFVERFIAGPERRIRRRRRYRAPSPTVLDTDDVLATSLPDSASPAAKEWYARLQQTIRRREAREAA